MKKDENAEKKVKNKKCDKRVGERETTIEIGIAIRDQSSEFR
jgi:hypothetical protein